MIAAFALPVIGEPSARRKKRCQQTSQFDCILIGRASDIAARGERYRLDDADVLAAIRIDGVAAIFKSTSSIGFLVQAWVT
jgi:hypothetical protein